MTLRDPSKKVLVGDARPMRANPTSPRLLTWPPPFPCAPSPSLPQARVVSIISNAYAGVSTAVTERLSAAQQVMLMGVGCMRQQLACKSGFKHLLGCPWGLSCSSTAAPSSLLQQQNRTPHAQAHPILTSALSRSFFFEHRRPRAWSVGDPPASSAVAPATATVASAGWVCAPLTVPALPGQGRQHQPCETTLGMLASHCMHTKEVEHEPGCTYLRMKHLEAPASLLKQEAQPVLRQGAPSSCNASHVRCLPWPSTATANVLTTMSPNMYSMHAQGQGVLSARQARPNVIRHAVQKVGQLLSLPRAQYNTEWLQTNRWALTRTTEPVAGPN